MKLYLAGPMRGIALYNFPAFDAATARLRALGHDVWSPAEQDRERDGFNPATDTPRPMAYYMRFDLPAVAASDAVAVLPGWRASRGARLEVHVARECGIPALDAETLNPADETVLTEAARLTSADRNRHYGHPRDNFAATAAMFTAFLRSRRLIDADAALTGRDVGMLMVLLKVARDANLPQRDNLVDVCGYARCVERLDEPAQGHE